MIRVPTNRTPTHPGEVLLEDFMKPLALTQYHLAHDIGVTPIRISQIVNGQRTISVDTAMRLVRHFDHHPAVGLVYPQSHQTGEKVVSVSPVNGNARGLRSATCLWFVAHSMHGYRLVLILFLSLLQEF
jgi:addiction module HigA family antidote